MGISEFPMVWSGGRTRRPYPPPRTNKDVLPSDLSFRYDVAWKPIGGLAPYGLDRFNIPVSNNKSAVDTNLLSMITNIKDTIMPTACDLRYNDIKLGICKVSL
ncbi:jg10282 [Pararge aegeria aegeria]|uniref:Jg10282 protein n=1 Tax=Pararge aegeria aegeria TaxID=348720 RepID=A0A8S4SC04_9NEOP|nr:jg10282 [Pararge aegeria aegeria]